MLNFLFCESWSFSFQVLSLSIDMLKLTWGEGVEYANCWELALSHCALFDFESMIVLFLKVGNDMI